jgi:hypothetical protein
MRPLLPRQFPFLLVTLPRIPRNAMGRIPRTAVAKKIAAQVKQRAAAARAKA